MNERGFYQKESRKEEAVILKWQSYAHMEKKKREEAEMQATSWAEIFVNSHIVFSLLLLLLLLTDEKEGL